MSIEEFITIKDMVQGAVLADIVAERDKQDDMWGDQTHDPTYWLAILGKQTGQLGSAVLDYKWADVKDVAKMYEECTQVAAVATAMMEAILNERLADEVTSAKPEPRKLRRILDRVGPDYTKDDEEVHDVQLPDEPKSIGEQTGHIGGHFG